MMLEDAKTHFSETLKILGSALPQLPEKEQEFLLVNKDYFNVLKDFYERFKLWKPSVYVYVEGGVVQGASADCDMHFNLFDDDNEKASDPEDLSKMQRHEPDYHERKETWNWMIESSHRDGTLKPIF